MDVLKITAEEQVALPSDLKRANRQKILNVLKTGRVMTAADIHEETGISRPTVMRALQHYCQKGVIQSMGLGSATSMGGKKPELFRFSDTRKILCVNFWPESISLALCGLISDVYATERFTHTIDDDISEAFRYLGQTTRGYLEKQGLSIGDLYGVALNMPGAIDYDSMTLRYNVKVPGWGVDVPLEALLKKTFGDSLTFFVDNAGKAAGRAVLLDHPEYAQRRLLTLFTTWGVSACMLERGHVLNGSDSLIGEIGHMLISDNGPRVCGCGKRGCLESLVSLSHVRSLLLKNRAIRPEDPFDVTFAWLFQQSAAGNEKAREVVRYLAHCFAVALHNLSLTYNQDTVIFQGDFALADETFDRRLREELNEFHYYPRREPFAILYDQRDLTLLAARGGSESLRKMYFSAVGQEE